MFYLKTKNGGSRLRQTVHNYEGWNFNLLEPEFYI